MSIFAIGSASKGSGGVFNGATNTWNASAVNTLGGDLIVVAVYTNKASSVTSITVTDTAGNTYTPGSVYNNGLQFFYCIGATANSSNVVTVTITATGSPNSYSFTYVWSIPLSGAATLDTSANGASSGSSNSPVTAGFNTTGTDELVLAAAVNDFSGITYTAGSGYTLDDGSIETGLGGAENQLLSSAQTGMTASFSQSGSTDWNISAIAFRAGSAPPPPGGGQVVVIIME